MVRLFIDVGRRHQVNPGDIVGAIANEADIPGKAIGAIDVNDRFTLVDIPSEFVEQVLKRMQRSRIRKQNMNVRLATSGDVDTGREKPRERDFGIERSFDDEQRRPERAGHEFRNRRELKGKKTKRKDSKKPFPKRKKSK